MKGSTIIKFTALVLISLLILLSSCATQPRKLPEGSTFTATAKSIEAGKPVTFNWRVPGADYVRLTDSDEHDLVKSNQPPFGALGFYPDGTGERHYLLIAYDHDNHEMGREDLSVTVR